MDRCLPIVSTWLAIFWIAAGSGGGRSLAAPPAAEASPRADGLVDEARLAALIARAFPASQPATARAQLAEPLDYSAPVAGLAMRIDQMAVSRYGVQLLLRFRNAGDQSITIPIGNPLTGESEGFFDAFARTRGGDWERIVPPVLKPKNHADEITPATRPAATAPAFHVLTLKPGQTALVFLEYSMSDKLLKSTEIKVVIHRAATPDASAWAGRLESAPSSVGAAKLRQEADAPPKPPLLPLPTFFPPFSPELYYFGNGSGSESDVECLSATNRFLAAALELYDPVDTCRELERRMADESDPAMRIYLASLAAPRGSRAAVMLLLNAMRSTDYATALNVHSAMEDILYELKPNPPDWAVQMAISVIRDQRQVTGLEVRNRSPDPPFTVGYLAEDFGRLIYVLGRLKCRAAVPTFIGMVERNNDDQAITVLGDIGDERAVPIILDVLRKQAVDAHIGQGMVNPESFRCAARSLGQLKTRAAVPILLEHLFHQHIVEALEAIGDPAAVPALERLVADGKPLQVEGSSAESDRNALWAARIALVTLKETDPIPGYCKLLSDQSLGEYARREVVWKLGNHPDARAVPFLVTAIKSDPSGGVRNQALTVLVAFKSKAAIAGLIDCFDGDFSGKTDWKRAYTPEMFRQNIAESLRTLTGQPIGDEPEEWRRWWKESGSGEQ